MGALYADLGRLDVPAALQGYEKALSLEAVKIYPPALNTLENLAVLFKQLRDMNRAEDAYSRALSGVGNVFGRSSERHAGIATVLNDVRRNKGD